MTNNDFSLAFKDGRLSTIETVDPLLEEKLTLGKKIKQTIRLYPLATFSVIVITILALIAIFAPFLATFPPNDILADFNHPPNATYLLGTDDVGRDLFSRLVFGSRISMTVGFLSVSIYLSFGTILGLIAGYYGGLIDTLIMRITDIFLAFPNLIVILVLVSILGPSLATIIFVIALLGWPSVCRIVRSGVLSLKEQDFILASIATGYTTWAILRKMLFPNILSLVLINGTFGFAQAILLEAALSFLGMGVRAPTASWGTILTQAQSLSVLQNQPWLWLPPGFLILLTVLAVNYIGESIRASLDKSLN